MKAPIKLVIWYVAGSIWLGFIMATGDELVRILFNFAVLTVGLTTGLLLKEQFLKRPWLIVFVPIIYFIVGMFL